MVSQESFKHRLRGLIEEKTPFAAYWYPNGYGVMLLGPVTVHKWYLPIGQTGGYMTVEGEAKLQARKAAPGVWWKNLAKLRRKYYTEVVTVEFDGENIKTEGEIEL